MQSDLLIQNLMAYLQLRFAGLAQQVQAGWVLVHIAAQDRYIKPAKRIIILK